MNIKANVSDKLFSLYCQWRFYKEVIKKFTTLPIKESFLFSTILIVHSQEGHYVFAPLFLEYNWEKMSFGLKLIRSLSGYSVH